VRIAALLGGREGKKRKNHEDWHVTVDLPCAAELVEEVNGVHPVLAGEVDEARGTRCCSMRPSAAFPWRGSRREARRVRGAAHGRSTTSRSGGGRDEKVSTAIAMASGFWRKGKEADL
jgi:hypothetical protein